MTYETRETKMTADDGTEITVIVPTQLPTEERGEQLRALYTERVTHPGGDWKGLAVAVVPPELADDVAEAMDFHGSIVDRRTTEGDLVRLESDGYWAHGF